MEFKISPVTRPKSAAKGSYDKLSRWYDLVTGSEKKYRELGLQKLAVHPGERVLEIGYGTGQCLLALAKAAGEHGQVVGIDISEGMRGMAQKRLAKAGLADRVQLQIGDAASLPVESGSFDAVYISFTLELFDTPEIPQVLAQCIRALREGGRICVVALAKQATDTLPVRIYEWFHARIPNYVDCRPIFAKQAIRNAGFEIWDVSHLKMWGLPIEIILAQKNAASQSPTP